MHLEEELQLTQMRTHSPPTLIFLASISYDPIIKLKNTRRSPQCGSKPKISVSCKGTSQHSHPSISSHSKHFLHGSRILLIGHQSCTVLLLPPPHLFLSVRKNRCFIEKGYLIQCHYNFNRFPVIASISSVNCSGCVLEQ